MALLTWYYSDAMSIYGTHIINQVQHPLLRPEMGDSTLHVVLVLSNPVRVHSRLRLFRETLARMEATRGVTAYVVEAAFGDRDWEVAEAGNPRHLRLRTQSEIWIKEAMINLGIKRLLPLGWKYAATVDGDIEFRDAGWAIEATHQLQHFQIIQPWSSALDLGPHGNVIQSFKSFGYQHQQGVSGEMLMRGYAFGHTGFAWAFTRAFFERTGGLIDFAIAGAGDHHMAWGCIGDFVDASVPKLVSADYKQCCRAWQSRAQPITLGQVGFQHGRIEHSFHGSKAKRNYIGRWAYLIANNFQPTEDLYYDDQGLTQLRGKPALEAAIRKYNRSRCEDDISE